MRTYIFVLILLWALPSQLSAKTFGKIERVDVDIPLIVHSLESIRMRSAPSTSAAVLKVFPAMAKFEIIEKGPLETINGKTDHWYKVKDWEGSGATGYMFGHFLSLRQEGRTTIILTYTNFEAGDYSHYFFTNNGVEAEYDLSHLQTSLEFTDESDNMNPALKNKKFKAVVNRVQGLVPVGYEEFAAKDMNIILEISMVSK